MEPITDHDTSSEPMNSHVTNSSISDNVAQREPSGSLVASSDSASSQLNGNSMVLGLSQKDNQAVFTLNAPPSATHGGAADATSYGRPDSQQFQSIENRRSKLLETFTVRAPDLDPKAKPVMEVKPRSSSSSETSGQTKQMPAGLKVALPKPLVKPKPLKKSSNNASQLSKCRVASNNGLAVELSPLTESV